MPVPDLPQAVGVSIVAPAHDELRPIETSPCAPASGVRPRRLRRLADWFLSLSADDGVSARFAAERQRDEGLIRRVERQSRR
jgi:hypothetical protein